MNEVIITGGNKGLGLSQARLFLQRGWRVHVVARTPGEIEAELGDTLTFTAADLANWRDTSWLEAIHARAGDLRGLVNNAGRHLKKALWDVEPDELEAVLDINLKAMFTACARFIKLRHEKGGSIVNISSMGGIMALQSAAAYVTSKTAVIGLTRSIALDAAPMGFRCNAVCPGFIDTEMTGAVLAKDPERRARIESRIPSHRFGSADDVARAVHFLISDESSYVNGVALPVDDGYSIGF